MTAEIGRWCYRGWVRCESCEVQQRHPVGVESREWDLLAQGASVMVHDDDKRICGDCVFFVQHKGTAPHGSCGAPVPVFAGLVPTDVPSSHDADACPMFFQPSTEPGDSHDRGPWPHECASCAVHDALDKIAAACGCPRWEYAGQVVRDVQAVVAERDALRSTADNARYAVDPTALLICDRDTWKARALRVEREVSGALGLPPTIGPTEGELTRLVTTWKAQRDAAIKERDAALSTLRHIASVIGRPELTSAAEIGDAIHEYTDERNSIEAERDVVRKILEENWCDCPCDHPREEQVCLACRIGEAIGVQ